MSGRHAGLVQGEEYKQSYFRHSAFLDGSAVRNGNPLNLGQNGFNSIHYLTDVSAAGMEEGDMRFTQLNKDRFLQDGDTITQLFYPYNGPGRDPVFATATDPVGSGFVEQDFTYRRYLNNVSYQREEVKSKALAWQSYLFDGHIVGLVGLREDDVTEYQRAHLDPETGEIVLNGNGEPNTGGALRTEESGNDLDPRTIGAVLPVTDPTGKTKTWSIVAHVPQKFQENGPVSSLAFHYADSENFQPGESGINHDLDFIPAPQGDTIEYGFDMGFADDKWNLRVNRFETDQRYKSAGSLNGQVNNARNRPRNWINNWYDVQIQNSGGVLTDGNGDLLPPDPSLDLRDGSGVVNIQNVWDAGFRDWADLVDAFRGIIPDRLSALYDYQLNEEGDAFVETGPGVDNLKGVQNVTSTGYGVYLTGRPNKNWNISANLTQTEAIPYGSGEPFGRYLGELYSNLQAAGLGNINEAVNGITKGSLRLQQGLAEVVNLQGQDGHPAPEVREWRFNGVANYKFTEGKFKGFGAGGAVRYQSSVSTGSELMILPSGQAISDPNKTFKGGSDTTFDSWISYRRKIMDNKADWKIQLNVRNLFGDKDDIVICTNPAGIDKLFRVAPDVRSWFITNTLTF